MPPSAGEGGVKGYDLLINTLISMMCVGTEYSHQYKKLADRVLLATASHQCFSLAMGMLGTLPPSHRVLAAMVEGTGLSLLVSLVCVCVCVCVCMCVCV